MLNAALSYADKGWPVFPLKVKAKTPIMARGYHIATTDTQKIKEWWGRWPDANIGIPANDNTFCVVDIDPLKGGDESLKGLTEEYGPVPDTLIQVTGSGGTHYCFKANPAVGNSESKLGNGIDTRGNNKGYIVVAPSIHPDTGNSYRWENPDISLADIPEWLIPGSTIIPPEQKELHNELPVASETGNICRKAENDFIPWVSVYDEQDNIEARARAYLQQCEPAVQGQGGHAKLLWACTAMVWGYKLDESTAYRLLSEEYNPVCCPPWDLSDNSQNREFCRKIREGKKEKTKAYGWLLDEYNREQELLIENGRRWANQLIASKYPETKQKEPVPINVIDEDQVPREVASGDILQPPGLLGDLCSWINRRARKKQPLLTLGNAIAFLGTLFGRKIRDEWDVRTNVYCLGIGAPACGKDNSRKAIKDLCAEAGITDNVLGGEEITSDTAIITSIKDRPSRLFQWDEIGHMLISMKDRNSSAARRTIVPMLMRLYSSSNTTFLGKEFAREERIDIVQPNVCIYGTTVPDTLWQGLTTADIRDGFLGRMMVFISEDDDPDVDEVGSQISDIPESLVKAITYWYEFTPEPPENTGNIEKYRGVWAHTIPTDENAKREFRKFRDQIREWRKNAREEQDPSEHIWGRVEENARKIALILAAADSGSAETATITIHHAKYACKFISHITKVFIKTINDNIIDNDTQEQWRKKIFKYIKDSKEKGVIHRDLTRHAFRCDRRTRDSVIKDLLEGEHIIKAKPKTSKAWHYFALPYGLEFINDK